MTSPEWQVRQTNHFVIVWWAHSVTATVHVSLTGLQNYLEHQMRETISEDEKKWNFLKKEASSFFSMPRRDVTVLSCCQAASGDVSDARGHRMLLAEWNYISLGGGLTDWVQQKCNKAASLDILNRENLFILTDYSVCSLITQFPDQGPTWRRRDDGQRERKLNDDFHIKTVAIFRLLDIFSVLFCSYAL